jgi:hypothetical protein
LEDNNMSEPIVSPAPASVVVPEKAPPSVVVRMPAAEPAATVTPTPEVDQAAAPAPALEPGQVMVLQPEPAPIDWKLSETMVAGFITQWGGIALTVLGALGFVVPDKIRAALGDPQTIQAIAGSVMTLGMVAAAFLGWVVKIGRTNGGKTPARIETAANKPKAKLATTPAVVVAVVLTLAIAAGSVASCTPNGQQQAQQLAQNPTWQAAKVCEAFASALGFATQERAAGRLSSAQIAAVDRAVDTYGPSCTPVVKPSIVDQAQALVAAFGAAGIEIALASGPDGHPTVHGKS